MQTFLPDPIFSRSARLLDRPSIDDSMDDALGIFSYTEPRHATRWLTVEVK
jgi:hypothetical protein